MASPALVILAFATVYIVWGSTYFFIQMAMSGFPPLLLGAIRFLVAGTLLLGWCLGQGERIVIKSSLITSAVVGILLLVVGNGVVIWVEQTLPSALAAILVSSAPIWFVLLDKPNWVINFKSKATIGGLVIGFIGVIVLFGEQLSDLFAGNTDKSKLIGMGLLVIGSIAWSSGSLYSKHHPSEGSPTVNVAWQMIIAGLVFLPGSLLNDEFARVQWAHIPTQAWLALGYLILFGSIAAYSAYVWLLQVRPATQVSTYAYVNPVIAVILGVLFAHEPISLLQITGLVIILGSVLLINLSKYYAEKNRPLDEEDSDAKFDNRVAGVDI
ncbi:Permease of the drug/metabolite transporter (DMT) superfamily [Spirosoma endophyticum]|uniref:Permease of the drug/metabolite transporter (DMT) superfamily n=2 Tax=Spirosoma endophyticum TaxID=662367 RepID=A0A1I2CF48_9BACT|nr:Permease of the drug/metabolite transporter (DMT) superfamily [Spirosoma endophyticum]